MTGEAKRAAFISKMVNIHSRSIIIMSGDVKENDFNNTDNN